MKRTLKRYVKPNGFTLIELLAVVVIISILTTVGAIAISAAIDRTNRTKVRADFSEFETTLTYTLNSSPQLARSEGHQCTDVLRAFTENAEQELKVDLSHTGSEDTLHNGGSTLVGISEISETTVVSTFYKDPWGTPYKVYVTGDNLGLTGKNGGDVDSPDAELRIFIISNGPNTIGGTATNLIDVDDIVLCAEYVNGVLRMGYHNTDNTDLTKLFWFSNDYTGFDDTKALNPESADSVLNMNFACLRPVSYNETE
jgi:prepilin-type N-terminal cleavage/methylation domain-containing protein